MANEFDYLVAAKAAVKTVNKRLDEIEAKVKADFKEQYKVDGTDRRRSTVFGPKAAWMTMKGGKPSEHVKRFTVHDMKALGEWMDENDPDVNPFVQANLDKFAEWWCFNQGECPDGCTLVEYDNDPTEPVPVLTVKEDIVIPMLRENPSLLGEVNRLLLGDGE